MIKNSGNNQSLNKLTCGKKEMAIWGNYGIAKPLALQAKQEI
jgi:hypothetical protein